MSVRFLDLTRRHKEIEAELNEALAGASAILNFQNDVVMT